MAGQKREFLRISAATFAARTAALPIPLTRTFRALDTPTKRVSSLGLRTGPSKVGTGHYLSEAEGLLQKRKKPN